MIPIFYDPAGQPQPAGTKPHRFVYRSSKMPMRTTQNVVIDDEGVEASDMYIEQDAVDELGRGNAQFGMILKARLARQAFDYAVEFLNIPPTNFYRDEASIEKWYRQYIPIMETGIGAAPECYLCEGEDLSVQVNAYLLCVKVGKRMFTKSRLCPVLAANVAPAHILTAPERYQRALIRGLREFNPTAFVIWNSTAIEGSKPDVAGLARIIREEMK